MGIKLPITGTKRFTLRAVPRTSVGGDQWWLKTEGKLVDLGTQEADNLDDLWRRKGAVIKGIVCPSNRGRQTPFKQVAKLGSLLLPVVSHYGRHAVSREKVLWGWLAAIPMTFQNAQCPRKGRTKVPWVCLINDGVVTEFQH